MNTTRYRMARQRNAVISSLAAALTLLTSAPAAAELTFRVDPVVPANDSFTNWIVRTEEPESIYGWHWEILVETNMTSHGPGWPRLDIYTYNDPYVIDFLDCDGRGENCRAMAFVAKVPAGADAAARADAWNASGRQSKVSITKNGEAVLRLEGSLGMKGQPMPIYHRVENLWQMEREAFRTAFGG